MTPNQENFLLGLLEECSEYLQKMRMELAETNQQLTALRKEINDLKARELNILDSLDTRLSEISDGGYSSLGSIRDAIDRR